MLNEINDYKLDLWGKTFLKDRMQDIKDDKQSKEYRYDLTDRENS